MSHHFARNGEPSGNSLKMHIPGLKAVDVAILGDHFEMNCLDVCSTHRDFDHTPVIA